MYSKNCTVTWLHTSVNVCNSQVDSKYDAGKYEAAKRASRIALILNIIGLVVGIVVLFMSVIVVPIVAIAATSWETTAVKTLYRKLKLTKCL